MSSNTPGVDIIADILQAVTKARPEDEFSASLWQQYQERGNLSKKQLEGLLGKATKFTEVSPGKLATLEAIIKKKNQVHRSETTEVVETKIDDTPLQYMNAILEKYPEHKRILFLKSKWEKGETMLPTEIDDISRLKKVLIDAKK